MAANINEDEFRLLTYLHEHATGFDERFMVAPKDLREGLGCSEDDLLKSSSYLKGHNLVDLDYLDIASYDDPTESELLGVWITSFGEDYVRELEKQPGIPKRLTVAVFSEVYKMGKDVIISVLTEHLKGAMSGGG